MDSSGSMVFKVDHFVSPIRRKKRVFYSKDLKELILKISRANIELLERDKRFFHAKVAAQLEENGYDIGRQALARKLREILDEPPPKNDSEYSQQFVSDLQVVREAIGKSKQARVKDERLLYKGDTVFDRPIQMHPPTQQQQQQSPSTPIPGGEHTMSVSPQSGPMDSSLGTNLNDPRRPNTGKTKSKDKRLQYKGHVIHLDEWRSEEPGGVGRQRQHQQQQHRQQQQPQASSSGMAGMVQSMGQGLGQAGQGHGQGHSQRQSMGPGTPGGPGQGQGMVQQGSPVQGQGMGQGGGPSMPPGTPGQGYVSGPSSSGRPSPNTASTPNPDFSALLSDDIDTDLQADLAQELNPIGLGLSNVQSVQGLIDAVGQVSQGNCLGYSVCRISFLGPVCGLIGDIWTTFSNQLAIIRAIKCRCCLYNRSTSGSPSRDFHVT
ncbi:hypothetical protein B0I73DRAFT_172212 [Yarrowia lipolytica]|nr:hypothetical protein B0I73DRAFT_172212 [Yarrowia lipolytica]RDW42830.1 hypothetical protein B0I74DRAFT_176750 [Yarrowia lipolytica]RDW49592.1 hypothetical protein B0I75DRAFT_161130 [Yarrowia lipolytica]